MSDFAEDFALNDLEVEIVVVLGASTLRLNQILQLGRDYRRRRTGRGYHRSSQVRLYQRLTPDRR